MSDKDITQRLSQDLTNILNPEKLTRDEWSALVYLAGDALSEIMDQRRTIEQLTSKINAAEKAFNILGTISEQQMSVLSRLSYHYPENEKFDIDDMKERARKWDRHEERMEAEEKENEVPPKTPGL